MNTFLVNVRYYDSIDEEEKFSYHLLRGNSFCDVLGEIEEYYGEDLLGFDVAYHEDFLGRVPSQAMTELYKQYEKGYFE